MLKRITLIAAGTIFIPPIIIGTWTGAGFLAGDFIPVHRQRQVFFLAFSTLTAVGAYIGLLRCPFRYRWLDISLVLLCGAMLTTIIGYCLYTVILSSFA